MNEVIMMRKSLATLVAVLFVVLITGCSPSPQKTACEANNLLLDISAFPTNVWKEIGSRDRRGAPSRLGIERAGTSFSTPTQGVAVQDFYRFSTIDEAEKNYAELQTDWFNLAPKGSILISPLELQNVQLGADTYRLGCTQHVIETCRLVALYQTFVVEFKVDMPSLTYNDLVRLLQEIDRKMMSCISN
jgi:hypothetical protein